MWPLCPSGTRAAQNIPKANHSTKPRFATTGSLYGASHTGLCGVPRPRPDALKGQTWPQSSCLSASKQGSLLESKVIMLRWTYVLARRPRCCRGLLAFFKAWPGQKIDQETENIQTKMYVATSVLRCLGSSADTSQLRAERHQTL